MSEPGFPPAPPLSLLYEPIVQAALAEDLGLAGDLTTDAVVDPHLQAAASIQVRKPGCIAGLDLAACAFRLLDRELVFEVRRPDGSEVEAGTLIADLQGQARAILSAERTALNFLGRLSGIATATRMFVRVLSGTATRVVCTRKTTPGLRLLEKYAVRVGGGSNHRFGLDDAVLIKDNHIAIAGGIRPAVERARRNIGHMVKIEVEVESLEQLDEALALNVDAVLLDNMDDETLQQAVKRAQGRTLTEVSGGVTLQNAGTIAATGADFVSVGWLTHSAPCLDVSLDL